MKRSPLGSTICIATSFALLLSSARAFAEPPGVEPLERDGVSGYWFPEPIARRALADVEELRVRRAEIDLCRKQSELRSERAKQLDAALKAASESAAKSRAVVDEAVRGREQAERERSGWLAGKPWLWGIVGTVFGVAGTALVVHYTRR